MIRVLLVEDSVVQREILRKILRGEPTITIVGEARNGNEAVRMAHDLAPDVVLMDIHMPEMNGVDATRAIMGRCPVPIVIVSATLKKRDMDLGVEALHAGAVSIIAKPKGAVLLNLDKISSKVVDEIVAASKVKLKPVVPRSSSLKNATQIERGEVRLWTDTIEAIGICTSTGGPSVLVEILSDLPRPFSIPILIVQHISAGFEESFAGWLSQRTGQPARLATQGQRLASGMWLAPAGHHLALLNSRSLTLLKKSPRDIHCPSGNPLFVSLAERLGPCSAGILLTGMGDDGADGLLTLKQAGGATIIQDEASSFIWGMPKAGKDLNAATYELAPRDISLMMTDWNSMP
ncbi:MAG TPA: chemotaxis protein CheB [Gemmataceae bacterium]|jgi:two-component system chemotaxis response regulator CheB|nr:chemotaxis protein CheB [Gemmataceae bacterium]